MTEEVFVRRYSPGDLEACRELWEQLTETHRQIYSEPGIGGSDPGRYFDEHLAKAGPDRILVAEIGSEVVGLTGILLTEEEAEVEPLVVRESFRGKGVGVKLAEAAILEAKKLGVKFVSVRPVARNVEAIRFFREQGFVNIGHVELFIDLSGKQYTPGVKLHGLEFRY